MLSHPRRLIRDTSLYRPFRQLFNGRTPSLKVLTEKVLGVVVQEGEHDSVEDARAAMRLYTSVKRVWESKKNFRLKLRKKRGAIKSKTNKQCGSEGKQDLKSDLEVTVFCLEKLI